MEGSERRISTIQKVVSGTKPYYIQGKLMKNYARARLLCSYLFQVTCAFGKLIYN